MENTERLWQGMFDGKLGVWQRADRLCFRTVAEGAEKCTLLLFEKGNEQEKKAVSMDRIGNSNVFSAEIAEQEAKKFDAYGYEADGNRFTDTYAFGVMGKDEFGVWNGEVRARLCKQQDEQNKDFVCPPFSDLVFYKLHVRGFTKHASSGVKHKGTFAGVAEKIPYLKELGINAVLLMPVYEFEECMEVTKSYGKLSGKLLAQYEERYGSEFVKVQQSYEKEGKEEKTVERINYWGYTDTNFYFSPKAAYASDKKQPGAELRSMVDALHAAGIAVFFEFFFGNESTHAMIADCIRYWTYVYGGDGFRLIGKEAALPLLLEDPYLSGVKFLVTDYGCGSGSGESDFAGRRVALYNDGFRNGMRRFVKGDENMVGEFVSRLTKERPEAAGIQYVADQNGFSLYDIYAYDRKHNEANGEDNKDGEDYNHSWNCGVEGDTAKKKINGLRARLRKNAISTVLLSQGVPMLFAGDEFGQTRQGNNNAYCQDNEISWLNWRLGKEKKEQLAFVKRLIAFRKEHRLLEGGRSLRESDWKNVGMPEVSYHGVMLWQPDFAPYSRAVSVLFSGAYGQNDAEEDLYLLFNMHWEELKFALPAERGVYKNTNAWEVALDTSEGCELVTENKGKEVAITADDALEEYFCRVPARTIVVLKRKQKEKKKKGLP